MSLEKMKQYFRKNWRLIFLIIIAISFFIGVSSYNYLASRDGIIKWGSPDETANYIFSKFYGQTGELKIFEKYNLYADDIIHPRSLRSDSGEIKPVSFLGLILIFGKIVSITSYKIMPYLTPIIAAIGIIFFYLLIKKIFGRRNAFMSSILLAIFPVYIYYSVRSMFHNVLFIVLLIVGLYLSVLMVKHKKRINKYLPLVYAGLAGSFIGLAIITRTSELIWLLPMLIVLWLFNIKKVGAIKLIIFLFFLFLSLTPAFYWNQILHGGFLKGGYTEMNESVVNIASASTDLVKGTLKAELSYHSELVSKIKENVFYFGFNPKQSVKMFYYYFVKMFYWLFWPAVLGFLWFLLKIKKWKYRHWAYLSSYFVISLILLFYYGSWKFHDNPDPNSFTIGNSYTRYWLPIYLGALPFVSMFIIKLTKLLKKKFYISSARIAIIILIFFTSIQFVSVGSEEGLVFSLDRHKRVKYEYEKVLGLTEHNSVIITRYHDKIFFPERKVIVGLFDNPFTVKKYAKLVNLVPVYYYNFTFPEKDINYLNNNKLAEDELRIEAVRRITSDFTLYKLYNTNIAE